MMQGQFNSHVRQLTDTRQPRSLTHSCNSQPVARCMRARARTEKLIQGGMQS